MPGTVRKIIDRIKDQRSAGNSVVALTVETRLVLQGFDPQRFAYDTPDDPGRLARIQEIAREMSVEVDDLIASADAEPDPEAAPEPPPEADERLGTANLAESAQAAAAAAGIGRSAGRPARTEVPEDHPLQGFNRIATEALGELNTVDPGPLTGASFAVLVRSSLLMALYSIATDRVFCDQLRYNELFQWFLGLAPGDARFEPEAFAADRGQALATPAGGEFFDRLVPAAGRHKLFSSDCLQVDGRRIKGWMSQQTNA